VRLLLLLLLIDRYIVRSLLFFEHASGRTMVLFDSAPPDPDSEALLNTSEYLRRLLGCVLESLRGAPKVSIIKKDVGDALGQVMGFIPPCANYFSMQNGTMSGHIQQLIQARNEYAHECDVTFQRMDRLFDIVAGLASSPAVSRAVSVRLRVLRWRWDRHKERSGGQAPPPSSSSSSSAAAVGMRTRTSAGYEEYEDERPDNFDYLCRALKVLGIAFRHVYAHTTSGHNPVPPIAIGIGRHVVPENLDSFSALRHVTLNIERYQQVLEMYSADIPKLKNSAFALFDIRNDVMHDTTMDIADDTLQFVFHHTRKLLGFLVLFYDRIDASSAIDDCMDKLNRYEMLWSSSRVSNKSNSLRVVTIEQQQLETTRQQLELIGQRVESVGQRVESVVQRNFESINGNLASHERRLNSIDGNLASNVQHLASMERRLASLEETPPPPRCSCLPLCLIRRRLGTRRNRVEPM